MTDSLEIFFPYKNLAFSVESKIEKIMYYLKLNCIFIKIFIMNYSIYDISWKNRYDTWATIIKYYLNKNSLPCVFEIASNI